MSLQSQATVLTQHGLSPEHLTPSQCESHLFQHLFNGNCFGCAGSACCALSQLYTPKQLGSRLLDDTHLLMQNAVLHMHLDLRISKLCTISSAVGLNLPVVGHELSNSDVEQNLHAWSLLFPSFIHVDDLVLSELHLFNMYWQSAAPLELTQISLLDVDT